MSITGAIKFFEKSRADIDYNATVVASSGQSCADYVRDRNNIDKWSSVGSSDVVREYLEIEFDGAHSINRLLLTGHNWKKFFAMWWDGASWNHFTSVVTKEGTQTNVLETVNAKTTSYYEFAEVSTTKITLQIDETIVANAEKTCSQVIVTKEIGTLVGFPQWTPSFGKNQIENKSVSGRPKYSIMSETTSIDMTFDTYPPAEDHALIQTMWDDQEEFLVWLCGGNDTQFRYPAKGNRLQDVWLVWFGDVWSPAYASTVYQNALSYSLKLNEVA